VESYEHRNAVQRIIPLFTPKKRIADIIVYPRAASASSSTISASPAVDTSSLHNGFGGRTGVVVGVDLTQPQVTAAVVSFIQTTVQLLSNFRTMSGDFNNKLILFNYELQSHVIFLTNSHLLAFFLSCLYLL
jgi:hypothetical protein